MAWGIRVDRSKVRDFDLKHGHIWVNDTEDNYVTKARAKRYRSKSEAEASVVEDHYEYAVEL